MLGLVGSFGMVWLRSGDGLKVEVMLIGGIWEVGFRVSDVEEEAR